MAVVSVWGGGSWQKFLVKVAVCGGSLCLIWQFVSVCGDSKPFDSVHDHFWSFMVVSGLYQFEVVFM